MELVDTHCHLDVADFDIDRDQILARCRQHGVNRIVVPGIHAAGWDGLITMCHREQGLYPALGLHPIYLDQHRDKDLVELEERVVRHRPLAVGEIGLDYYVESLSKNRQQFLLEQQLDIAQRAALPVILHVRKAHDQIIATLRRITVHGGICHAFNGSLQQAHHYIDLGFKLGFGGMLTYERSRKLRRLARDIPLTAIVLETDAPDMTVASHRGERNSPEYLPECLTALAGVRGEEPATVAKQTTQNALEILKLS